MKRKNSFLALLVFVSMMSSMGCLNAQAQKREAPDWRKLHYTSEEEMRAPVKKSINFTATPAPTEAPRFVAEFEPMQGVTIRYPLGIPVALVKTLAENCQVYCIVQSSSQSRARSQRQIPTGYATTVPGISLPARILPLWTTCIIVPGRTTM